jgi:hypothetical protein
VREHGVGHSGAVGAVLLEAVESLLEAEVAAGERVLGEECADVPGVREALGQGHRLVSQAQPGRLAVEAHAVGLRVEPGERARQLRGLGG